MYVFCRFCKKRLYSQESRTIGYGQDCAEERSLPHGLPRLAPDECRDQMSLYEETR